MVSGEQQASAYGRRLRYQFTRQEVLRIHRPRGQISQAIFHHDSNCGPTCQHWGGGAARKEGDAENAGYDDNGLSALSQGEGNAPIALFRLQAQGLSEDGAEFCFVGQWLLLGPWMC